MSSDANQYKHKSGSQKRKQKREKDFKTLQGSQPIAKFFKPEKETQKGNYIEPNTYHGNDELLPEIQIQNTEQTQESCILLATSSTSTSTSRSEGVCVEINTGKMTMNEIAASAVDYFQTEVVTIDGCQASGKDGIEEEKINHNDPATWPQMISDTVRQNIVQGVSSREFQKIYKGLPKDVENKKFPEYLLFTKTIDERTRQHFPREWLIWSTSKEALYCLPCRLFCDSRSKNLSNLA